jgi:hypothetical protein
MQLTKKHKLILTGAAILVASYVIHDGVVSVMSMASAHSMAQQPKPNPFPAIKPISPTPPPRPSVAPPPAIPGPASPATVSTPTPPAQPLASSPIAPPQALPVQAPAPVTSPPAATATQPENTPLPPARASALNGVWVGNATLPDRGGCRLRFEFHDDHQERNRYQGFFQLWCNATSQDRANPEAATFTGTTEDGIIRFKVAALIGADSHGCSPTTFTAMPFGIGQIVGEWKEATCDGGHMIMQRGR